MSVPKLFDIAVHPHTFESLSEFVGKAVACAESQQRGLEILNVNAHAINLCFSNPQLYRILQDAHQVFCDGEGVRMALKHRGYELPYRITYADWWPHLLSYLESTGLRFFMYGARESVLNQAVAKMRREHPRLNLCGFCHGFVPQADAVRQISESGAQVILVCLGMPAQEYFIHKTKDLVAPAVWLSGGAALDYYTGTSSRAPLWFCERGLEWFWRLACEPQRLFSRYVIGNPLFLWRTYRNIPPQL